MGEKNTSQNEERPIPSGWDMLANGLFVPDGTPSEWIDMTDVGGDFPLRVVSENGDFRTYEERMRDIDSEYRRKAAEQMSPLSSEELEKVLDSIDDSVDWQSPEGSLHRHHAKHRILEFLNGGTYIGMPREESSLSEFLQNQLNFICNGRSITYRKQLLKPGVDVGDWVEVEGVGYHGNEDMSIVFASAIIHELTESPQSARVHSLGEEPRSLDGIKPRDRDDYASRVRGSRAFVRQVKGSDGNIYYEARLSFSGEDLED